MSRPLKLKVAGTVLCRFSNSPITGYRAVCGGAPQTFSLPTDGGVMLIPRISSWERYSSMFERCCIALPFGSGRKGCSVCLELCYGRTRSYLG
jgi:hypothetical protein